MAQRPHNPIDFDDDGSAGSLLGRSLLWAGLAAIAVGGLVLAAQTQTGGERLARMFALGPGPVAMRSAPPPPPAIPARPPEVDGETRRLAETVRLLAADRDRLSARLDQLERSLDVTASVPRDAPSPPAAGAPTAPPPSWSFTPDLPPAAGIPALGAAPANPVPAADAPVGPSAARQPAAASGGLVATEQATASVATRTEFAADIGGDATLDGLRALWASLKSGHPVLMQGLRPVVAVREAGKPGVVELRLLVGPFANAGAAARLCAALAGSGLPCQPTVFDGQRLALR
jgi:hypothetical protein